MTRDRISALDERVSRLRADTTQLDEQNTSFQSRIRELELAVDDSSSPDREARPTPAPTESAPSTPVSTESALSTPVSTESAPSGDARQQASDEDVAEAIRTVERDIDDGATDACDDIIVV